MSVCHNYQINNNKAVIFVWQGNMIFNIESFQSPVCVGTD